MFAFSSNFILRHFCCIEGKTNGLLKFQPFLVCGFGVISIDNKKSKTIDLYSAYMGKNTGACLINHNSGVQWATELRLVPFYSPGTGDIVFDLTTPMLSSKKAVQGKKKDDDKVTFYCNMNKHM